MTKKLLVLVISALIVASASIARAESSATTFRGDSYREQQVWTVMYNNSGAAISSNQIVVIDTTATANSTLGAYFTTTTGAATALVIGVTDEVIANGSVGNICIRGPHKVQLVAFTEAPQQGASIVTSTTAGQGTLGRTTGQGDVVIGNLMSTAAVSATGDDGARVYWIWVERR